MHNLYTLRGAPVRDAVEWSSAIDEALRLFVDDTDVMFICHQWPVWGWEQISELLGMRRGLYRYLHDEALRLANHGCYGSTSHHAKAVYQHYLGWFNANPTNLNPRPPAEAGQRYVELIGGIDAVVAHAHTAHDAGEDRWAAELLTHALAADPGHQPVDCSKPTCSNSSATSRKAEPGDTSTSSARRRYATGTPADARSATPAPT